MTTKKRARPGSNAFLKDMYRHLNKEYFDNKCPRNFPVEWAKLPGTYIARVKWSMRGTETVHKPRVMQIDVRLKPKELQKQVGMSMIHEMCHIVCGVEADCREWNGKFDKMMFKLCKRGAFQGFW